MVEIVDLVRICIALTVFMLIALWEWTAPRRQQIYARRVRWPANVTVAILNVVLVRAITPVSAFGVALIAEANGWGLMRLLSLPSVVVGLLTFVALDLVIYGQHVAFHRIGAIWRFHRVHHADPEFDVTTGIRFHPVEMLISLAVKMATVLVLGVPALVVVVFEIVLNATSLFNHGNVRLPLAADAALRTVLVTPDMHRVHHSRLGREMNANFGFNFSWWDRLFATYLAQPAGGHSGVVGLDEFRDRAELKLGHVLAQPWRGPSAPRSDQPP